ncbi:ROK family protein [Streptomyces caeruleatus]|uniref:ROK family protein n=1 Tax=Streptomyces caeruleatus TaxID=661399 RepID=UPI000B28F468|nr:ROK family protein [Streptomyces caeruleatus]
MSTRAPALAADRDERVRTDVAVDLGGTWLRIRAGSGETVRLPAPSILNRPGEDPAALLEQLIETLAEAVPAGARVAMSCGAAMDEEHGVLHGSGPLWGGGPDRPVPLRALLTARRPDVSWHLFNDVTAGLASFVERFARPGHRRAVYVTVSSGIALRTADLTERSVPVDAHGLQGEVGHLPAVSTAPAAVRALSCPCGGTGHVAALAAGPALPHVAAALGVEHPEGIRDALPARLRSGDPAARRLLSTVVEPVAELVRTLRCLDPRIDLIGIGGGYAEGLGDPYRAELVRQVSEVRSYADRDTGPDRAAHGLRLCRPGEVDPMAGAVALSHGALTVTKR